jgi:hypothetical protein
MTDIDKFSEYLEETQKEEKLRRPLGAEMQCQNCIFWSLEEWRQEKKLANPAGDHSGVWGECRRHAPRPSDENISKLGDLIGSIAWAVEETAGIEHNKHSPYEFESGEYGEVWFWPKTQPYSWCGEFKSGRKAMSQENINRFEQMRDEAYKPNPDEEVAIQT